MPDQNEETEPLQDHDEPRDFDATWRVPMDDPDATYPLRTRE